MRKGKSVQILREILQVRTAEEAAAQSELFTASERLRAADDEVIRARERVAGAVDDWQRHLEQRAFLPELAQMHASEVQARTETEAAAQKQAAVHAEGRGEAVRNLQNSDAQLRLAREASQIARRASARHAEEKALERMEDRLSYSWSRR